MNFLDIGRKKNYRQSKTDSSNGKKTRLKNSTEGICFKAFINYITFFQDISSCWCGSAINATSGARISISFSGKNAFKFHSLCVTGTVSEAF